MGRGKELKVVISGDSDGLNRALNNANKGLDKFGKQTSLHARVTSGGFSRISAGATGVAAVFAGVALETKRMVDASIESEKVSKQTAAVLKSTGMAAGVNATQVEKLASALSRKTGIDDEVIQSSENLLLTFTKVRNEAGKGNDIFNQATTIVQDMSVAFDQSAKTSAIQLGKALNDPIKGVASLSKVGVSFTEQQKEQIKTLVESGDTLKAQKIIMAELTTEVGGSAEAQAQPIEKLKNTIGNLEEALGGGLKPTIDSVSTSMEKFISSKTPGVERLVTSLNQIFARKDLDLGDKFKLSGEKLQATFAPLVTEVEGAIDRADIPTKLGAAFEEAAPKVVDALASSAPRAAGAFVRGFQAAGPWGKLLTAAFVIQRLGGFSTAGSWAAGAVARQFKAQMAKSAVFGAAGTAAGEKASASLAQGLSDRISTSMGEKGRVARIKAAGTSTGKIFGAAAGVAAVVGLAELASEGFDAIDRAIQAKYGKPDGKGGRTKAGGIFKDLYDFIGPGKLLPEFKLDGPIPHLFGINDKAGGGRIPGSRVAADTVPAMLSPQEFVVTQGGERILENMTFPGVLNWLQGVQPRHFAGGGRAGTGLVAGSYGIGYDAGLAGRSTSGVLSQIFDALGDRVGNIGGAASAPMGMPAAIARMSAFGSSIAKRGLPYVYGGGHNAAFSAPYDCSGLVSAILHAGGALGSPLTTDGLKAYGESGSGKYVTIGVRGSTGKNAHTMIQVGDRFFESGGGGNGGHVRGGWNGSFPIKRHPKGMRAGGRVGDPELFDPRSPLFVGWGMAGGGRVRDLLDRIGHTNRLALPGLLRSFGKIIASPKTLFPELTAAQRSIQTAMAAIRKGGIDKGELSSYRGLKSALSMVQGEEGRRIGQGVSSAQAVAGGVDDQSEMLDLTMRAEGVVDDAATARSLEGDRSALTALMAGRAGLVTAVNRAKRTGNKNLIAKTTGELAAYDKVILTKRGDIKAGEMDLTASLAASTGGDAGSDAAGADLAALTAAIQDLKGSIDAHQRFADNVAGVTSMEAVRVVAEWIGGEYGRQVGGRRTSPGYGVAAAY